VGQANAPVFVDLDAVIEDLYGALRNFANGGAGGIAELTETADPFNEIDASYASSPTFLDLNADGDLDAVVTKYFGKIRAFAQADGLAVSVAAENEAPALADAASTLPEQAEHLAAPPAPSAGALVATLIEGATDGDAAIASFALAVEPGASHQPQDGREMSEVGDDRGYEDGTE
jgi:hypothetical protein